jgi:hypothetical protein
MSGIKVKELDANDTLRTKGKLLRQILWNENNLKFVYCLLDGVNTHFIIRDCIRQILSHTFILIPWRCMQQDPTKRWYPFPKLQSVTCRKMVGPILTNFLTKPCEHSAKYFWQWTLINASFVSISFRRGKERICRQREAKFLLFNVNQYHIWNKSF